MNSNILGIESGEEELRPLQGLVTTGSKLREGSLSCRGLPPLLLRSLYARRVALMYGQPARMVNFRWTRPRTLHAGRTVMGNGNGSRAQMGSICIVIGRGR